MFGIPVHCAEQLWEKLRIRPGSAAGMLPEVGMREYREQMALGAAETPSGTKPTTDEKQRQWGATKRKEFRTSDQKEFGNGRRERLLKPEHKNHGQG